MLGSDVNVYSSPWVKFLSWLDPGGMLYESMATKIVYGNTFQPPSDILATPPAPKTAAQMTQAGAWTPDMALQQYGVDWKQSLASSMDIATVATGTNWWLVGGLAAGAIGLILLATRR